VLLNDGSPSLVGTTRQYVGDPPGAARPLWDDTVVKEFINIAYSEYLDMARMLGMSWEHKVTHETVVADTQFYPAPPDNRRILEVMISTTGQNLATTSPSTASVARLQYLDGTTLESEYRLNRITTLQYWTMRGSEFGIYTAPTTASEGTNSIRLVYEGESPLLASDTAEPVFPRDTHNALCLRAAVLLLVGKRLPVADVREESRLADIRFRSSVRAIVPQMDEQITVAGLPVEMGLEKNSGISE
jgi:hypothetical protein